MIFGLPLKLYDPTTITGDGSSIGFGGSESFIIDTPYNSLVDVNNLIRRISKSNYNFRNALLLNYLSQAFFIPLHWWPLIAISPEKVRPNCHSREETSCFSHTRRTRCVCRIGFLKLSVIQTISLMVLNEEYGNRASENVYTPLSL